MRNSDIVYLSFEFLQELLTRAHSGENPDLLIIELVANCEKQPQE